MSHHARCDKEVKILVVGDFGVGKSSLVHKLCYGTKSYQYEPIYPTIGCAMHTILHSMRHQNGQCTISYPRFKIGNFTLGSSSNKIQLHNQMEDLWFVNFCDLGGKTSYKRTRQFLYEGADGAILVFDLTNCNSRKNLAEYWLPEINSGLSSVKTTDKPCKESTLASHSSNCNLLGDRIDGKGLLKPSLTARSRDALSSLINNHDSLVSRLITLPCIMVGTHLDRVPTKKGEQRLADALSFAASLEVDSFNISSLDPNQFTPTSEATSKMNGFYNEVINNKVRTEELANWGRQQLPDGRIDYC